MTCRKIRKLIPLAAGNDLPPRRARAFKAHLDTCAGCRGELEDFRAALARFTAAAGAERDPDWNEDEWRRVMARATCAGRHGTAASGSPGRVLRPSWAAAAVLGAFLGLVVLGLLVRSPLRRPEGAPRESGAALVADKPAQDRVAITMVSPESGLQIVWFLDKNFDYKGEQE